MLELHEVVQMMCQSHLVVSTLISHIWCSVATVCACPHLNTMGASTLRKRLRFISLALAILLCKVLVKSLMNVWTALQEITENREQAVPFGFSQAERRKICQLHTWIYLCLKVADINLKGMKMSNMLSFLHH